MKKRRVVIIGGGIAGLSAAHELIERDFEVTVFERNRMLGGKARSVDVQEGAALKTDPDRPPGTEKNGPLPGEHGFRFFPGWYRHLPDTMKRIPYPKTGKSVFENLVPAELSLLASYNRDPIKAVVKFPISWQQIKLVLKFPKDVVELVPVWDLEFFARKMVQFLVSCEERRLAEFEPQTWWDFMEADSRSAEFRQYLVMGATRNTIAAKAKHASAYTIAKMGIQTFTDALKPGGTVDRVLNGPTNDVWIEPWRVYLEQQGVKFRMGWELDGIVWPENDEPKPKNEIKGVRLTPARDYLKLAEARLETVQFLEDLINAVAGNPLSAQSPRARRRGSDLLPAHAGKLSRSAKEAWAVEADDVAELQTDAHYADEFRNLAKNLRAEKTLDVATLQTGFLAENPYCEDDLARGWEVLRSWQADVSVRVIPTPGQVRQVASDMRKALSDHRLRSIRKVYEEDTNDPYSLKNDDPIKITSREKALHAICRGLSAVDYLRNAVNHLRATDMDYLIAEADYFVFALPVEQMAFHVHNSPTLVRHDPNLLNIVALSEHVDWMAGIQFYLHKKANITPGHIDCLDSEWSLTAISQTQFWDDVDLKERGFGDCKSILSVDISSWDTPGGTNQKPAWDCTAQEIAEEAWEQLKRALNRPGQPPLLEDEMLCGGPDLIPARNYHLDDSIVDRYDRKKQGFYEKFRRVAFDGKALIDRRRDPQRVVDIPEAFGERVQVNAEPLLVNRCGSFFLRPDAKTRVPNMFLAADYVRTFTNLATMEGANEAARAAVNAILKASGMQRPPCDVWRLDEPGEALRLLDKELFERRQKFQDTYGDIPVRLAGAGIKAALGTAEKALDTVRGLWKSFRRDS